MPVANQGLEMKAMAKLGELAQGIQMILAVLPFGSDVAEDVSNALNKIRKHLKPGAENSGTVATEKQLEMLQQRQQGPQIASMRAGAGGAPGAPPAPPAPPAGAA